MVALLALRGSPSFIRGATPEPPMSGGSRPLTLPLVRCRGPFVALAPREGLRPSRSPARPSLRSATHESSVGGPPGPDDLPRGRLWQVPALSLG